jgi:hypothetical protein
MSIHVIGIIGLVVVVVVFVVGTTRSVNLGAVALVMTFIVGSIFQGESGSSSSRPRHRAPTAPSSGTSCCSSAAS